MKNSSVTLKSFIFWAACIALALSLLVFVLEKTRIVNFYSKPAANSTSQTNGDVTDTVNVVDYSPASSSETETGKAIKDEVAKQSGEATAAPSTLTVTLSAANQDDAGGPIVVRTIVGGATGGSCTITMSKGSTVKTFSATISSLGMYYGCNTDIPYAELSNGTWQLKLVANQNNAIGSASQEVVVRSQ